MSLILLIGSLIGGDVGTLDSDKWVEREHAQARLRAWGLCAVPKLLAGAESDSPEVRARCHELLGKWKRRAISLEAIRVLTAKHMPEELSYWHNEELRIHVAHIALKAGCIYYDFSFNGEITPQIWEQSPWDAWLMLDQFREQIKRMR